MNLAVLQPTSLLGVLVFVVAFLYASVGFGGGSGYLAVMSFYDIHAQITASTALSLNVVVAGVALVNFSRRGHLQPRLLWPFVMTSIPFAFIGGTIPLHQDTYQVLLNVVLTFVALRLLFSRSNETVGHLPQIPSSPLALFTGALLGLLSGMLGVGGGIFLSPVILLSGWGTPQQAAASSAGFILLNSISGLLGRAAGGTLQFGQYGGLLLFLGILGGLAGSFVGARYLSGVVIRQLLGILLLVAVARFLLAWLI
jgi:uncharacterized protein